MRSECEELEWQEQEINATVGREADANTACARTDETPGNCPPAVMVIVLAMGDGTAFKMVRDLADWLSLKPCEVSVGGEQRLGA